MPDEPDRAATALLPVTAPDADGADVRTDRDPAGPWRARAVLFEVTAQRIAGPPTRARFPVARGRLELAGSTVARLELHPREPERASMAYRALLGRHAPADRAGALALHCTAAPARRRLAGELLAAGLTRAVSLRITLLDPQPRTVLIWLTGQVQVPVRERRIGHSHPRLLIAAEFTR